MIAIGIMGAIATIIAAGFGLLMLIVRQPERLHLAEQLAISWLFGTGVVSLLLWVLGFVFSREILFAGVMVVCVGLGVAGWKRHGGFRNCRSRRLTIPERGLIFILVAQVLVIGYLSLAYTLGWDGLLNWEIKARYAFANGGSLPAAYFQDAGRAFSHAEYPLAIPFSELWIYLWIGEASQFWAKAIFPVFYLCGVTLLAAIGTRLSGKLWTGLAAAIVIFFVPQVTVEAGSVIVAYADFPLSVFFLAAVGYLLCVGVDDQDDVLAIAIVCSAFLPWVKREGMVLWPIAVLCGSLIIWRKRKSFMHLLLFVPGLLISAIWNIYLRQMHVITSPDFMAMNLKNLLAHLDRFGPIAASFLPELSDLRAWGIFWLVAAFAGVYLVRRFRDIRAVVIIIAIAAPLVMYGFAFVFSAWPDYHRHMGLSLSRLLMHVTPVAGLTLPVALAALPSWRVAFVASPVKNTVATCAEQIPGRTAGIDFA